MIEMPYVLINQSINQPAYIYTHKTHTHTHAQTDKLKRIPTHGTTPSDSAQAPYQHQM